MIKCERGIYAFIPICTLQLALKSPIRQPDNTESGCVLYGLTVVSILSFSSSFQTFSTKNKVKVEYFDEIKRITEKIFDFWYSH